MGRGQGSDEAFALPFIEDLVDEAMVNQKTADVVDQVDPELEDQINDLFLWVG